MGLAERHEVAERPLGELGGRSVRGGSGLSLVPIEVVHVVPAVIARVTFESLQRYVKLNGATLPTVLVMEEGRELPPLPWQSAVMLGWASKLPVLVKMNELPRSQQPRSDPEFWGVWIGKDDAGEPITRDTVWSKTVSDWQAAPAGGSEGDA